MWLTFAILSFVTMQRAAELVLSSRNTARLNRKNAHEVGAGHYPLLVALHAAWLAGLWVLAWERPINIVFLGAFIILQGLRMWVLATLGSRWTTRIIIVAGERLISSGPYRFVRHPNYCIVAGEIICLPLVFGLIGYAGAFGILTALLLWVRVKCEDAALAGARKRS